MSDISQFAPDVLRHAEDLLQRMRDYESIASPTGYRIGFENLIPFGEMAGAALSLEKALVQCGFSCDEFYSLSRDDGLSLSPVVTVFPAKLLAPLASIARVCRAIRLSRHADTPQEHNAVCATWGQKMDGGWGLDPDKDTTFPPMGAYADQLEPLVDMLRRAVGQPAPANLPEQSVRDCAPAPSLSRSLAPLSLCRVGEVWRLRYHDEEGDFPVSGNHFIGWLAKLLAKPNYHWTIAELIGDLERKIAADAALGGEDALDAEGIRETRKEIETIDEFLKMGGSEQLENERARLLRQLNGQMGARLKTAAENAYNNISTQKRKFLPKLGRSMPKLASHLKACLDHDASSYAFSYRPPEGSSRWQIENPPA
jgi:hypothetical protein